MSLLPLLELIGQIAFWFLIFLNHMCSIIKLSVSAFMRWKWPMDYEICLFICIFGYNFGSLDWANIHCQSAEVFDEKQINVLDTLSGCVRVFIIHIKLLVAISLYVLTQLGCSARPFQWWIFFTVLMNICFKCYQYYLVNIYFKLYKDWSDQQC